MKKRKTHSELEHLRGELREALKENRALRGQLKKYVNKESQYENNKEELEALATLQANEEEYQKSLKTCQECFKGTLSEYNILGNKWILTCITCGNRHSEIRPEIKEDGR